MKNELSNRTLARPATSLAACLMLAAAATAEVPRRHDGRPDLSGTYNTATLTPLVRPSLYGDRLELTAEEAKAIADTKAERYASDYAPSDPDREAPPVGGSDDIFDPSLIGAAGGVGGYNAFYLDPGENTFMIDGKYRTSIMTDPPDGRFPPLTPAGRAQAAAASAGFQKNTGTAWWIDREIGPYDDMEQRPLPERCILGFGSTAGPPMLPSLYNSMKTIVHTDDYVVILVEMNHDARIIRMQGSHLPASIDRWMGDSVGHWEGDTLVVETRNLKLPFGMGLPVMAEGSDRMRVVERFRRTDAGTLIYSFTVDDPSTWTAPWSGEYPWPRSEHRVYEYACHEGNYALGNIMRGARLLESEARADSSGGR